MTGLLRRLSLKIAPTCLGLAALCSGLPAQASEFPASDIRLPVQFQSSGQDSEKPTPIPSDPVGAWWRAFHDPALDSLIERLHLENTSILQSAAHLSAARAKAHLGAASRLPQVGLDASATHASGPLVNDAGGSGSLFTARVSASWEADLFGRLSGMRTADRLDAKASEALLRDTRLLMETEAVRAYFETLYLQQAEAGAAQVVALWRQREAIAGARARNGFSQQIDLGQMRQRSLASAADAATLSRELAEARDRLAFLVGETAPVAMAATVLPAPPRVPAGLPSEVLARRPDVDAAASRLEAADQRLKSARRSWLPSFTLTASGGAASPSLGEILSSSARDFGAGLLFSLPLFDGGRHKAVVAGGKAELDLAKAQCSEAMLAALRDVNDALAGVSAGEKQARLADESLDLGESEAAIQSRRAALGTVSRAAVLDAELAASQQRQEALRARYQNLAATIGLIKALGGGWTDN